jgi:hypothetical protein
MELSIFIKIDIVGRYELNSIEFSSYKRQRNQNLFVKIDFNKVKIYLTKKN